ncbi:TetR/AcrR family transcriptional regulator [Desertimonas flava]|uniref:TetR/AcrR family transcriptional regulator n=1 Tax=Desertimonas flava TaxID=2064846 RepID=UPI000E340B20|nr:TetR/AcrR family transcriptional regulator [Desertimonas flava]
MTTDTSTRTDGERVPRRQADKFAERRRQLAESALATLSELGYARTSLRDIAYHSGFTHGVLHYYFRDKADLIAQGVRQYNERCVTRYDDILATATTADELREGFALRMADTLLNETEQHRLWIDLRTQSLFDPSFRDAIVEIDAALEQMIWKILTRYAELDGMTLAVSPPFAYALFDGIFQMALVSHIGGDENATDTMTGQINTALALLKAGAGVTV